MVSLVAECEVSDGEAGVSGVTNPAFAIIFAILAVVLGAGTASGQSPPAVGRPAQTPDASNPPLRAYLAMVNRKVTERWVALHSRQPVVTFEIARDGEVSNVAVKDSSGNRYYDRLAMRTIIDAVPFPPLPDDFPGSVLGVHLGFNFATNAP